VDILNKKGVAKVEKVILHMPYKKTFLLSILIKLKMCSVPIWILPNLQLPAFGLGRKDCAFQSTKVIRSNATEKVDKNQLRKQKI